MQHRHIIQLGAGLIAVFFAAGLATLPAQEPFPQVPPGGYQASGQPQNGYSPGSPYQRSVTPYEPTTAIRPDSFPGGPGPQGPAAAPAYGPVYHPASQQAPGGAVPASFLGQPAGAIPVLPAAPAQLCEMSQVIGRVGNEVVLTSDVLVGVDDMITRAKGRIPASKVAEQRAALVQEVTAGIAELNAHYKEPDPVKSMSVSRRNLLYQLVQQQVNVKLIYQDFIKTVPKEAHAQIEETVARRFEELQLPALMKRENVSSRADLENSLLAKGSSMAREKRIFGEQILAQNWIQEKVSGEKDEKEVTHEEMLAWYQAHMAKYEIPAKARWEELMISFARHANHDEAYAAVAALGNRILAGATLADVAKSASDGLTARQGGVHEWTGKGSLSSEKLDQAVFSLPVGQLSQILESESGYHIIRVLERQELSRKSFLDVQKEIKGEIKADRFEKRYKEFVEGLREKYLVWTVFDNVMKPKANPEEEEDRYSRQ